MEYSKACCIGDIWCLWCFHCLRDVVMTKSIVLPNGRGTLQLSRLGFCYQFFLSCLMQRAFQLLYSSSILSLALPKQQAAFSSPGWITFYVVFNTEGWLSRWKCHSNAMIHVYWDIILWFGCRQTEVEDKPVLRNLGVLWFSVCVFFFFFWNSKPVLFKIALCLDSFCQ